MELTWNIGERRRGVIYRARSLVGANNVCKREATFVVRERHPDEENYDWEVADVDGGYWGVCEDWGTTLVDEGLQKKPESKEIDMDMEARKKWALEQDWGRYVPEDKIAEHIAPQAMPGDIYAVAISNIRHVVLIVEGGDQGRAMILAGNGWGKQGSVVPYHKDGRHRYSALLLGAEETRMPKLWKLGEVRRGLVHNNHDVASAIFTEGTYRVTGPLDYPYDWEIQMLDGPHRGKTFGAVETWRSEVVEAGEVVLSELTLDNYEEAATQPGKRIDWAVGQVWMARRDYNGDATKITAGQLMVVKRVRSTTAYFIGARPDGSEHSHGTLLQEKEFADMVLMARRVGWSVGAKTLVPKDRQCGDRSTAYGLTCTEERGHGGEKHRRGDAEWAVAPAVIKLGRCANGHVDAEGAPVMAVAEVIVSKMGQKFQFCKACILNGDAHHAAKMRERDEKNPQPRYQPRYRVDSMTLDAGGVFSVKG